jgi:uncharacterized protein (DUF433 family)
MGLEGFLRQQELPRSLSAGPDEGAGSPIQFRDHASLNRSSTARARRASRSQATGRRQEIQPGHPLFGLIWINPKRVSGAPCFYGTRVPIKNLFDSIAAGESVDEFLDGFEGVTRTSPCSAGTGGR